MHELALISITNGTHSCSGSAEHTLSDVTRKCKTHKSAHEAYGRMHTKITLHTHQYD